jgi:hypothetical protein
VEAADDNRAGMVSAAHLEVRRAGPEDAPAIAAVLHASFVEFKALYTEGGFAATTLGTEQVLTRMREGPIWVALREGAVMGTVAAVVKNESVYVRGMAVLPAARATGAGTVYHGEGRREAPLQVVEQCFPVVSRLGGSLHRRHTFSCSNRLAGYVSIQLRIHTTKE